MADERVEPPENEFLVAVSMPGEVLIMKPPRGPISQDRALALAAWIVAIVGDRDRFDDFLVAVEST